MSISPFLRRNLRIENQFAVQFVSIVVAAHGVFIMATTLLDQLNIRGGAHISDIVIDLPLLIGLSLVYLGTLLKRRKRTAWTVTVLAYAFYLGIGAANLVMPFGHRDVSVIDIIRIVVLPLAILGLLLVLRNEFIVRSDVQGLRWALRFSLVMLVVTFVYGTAGFQLFDHTDFHQEISLPAAMHYTIDQFDLTTNHPIHPYTKRAKLFVDSLSFVSVGAVVFVVLSLFQPIRLRWSDQAIARQRMEELLKKYGGNSEDFFKLWPHDKQYFFSGSGNSGLAYHVYRGVALSLGDPAGDKREYRELLADFKQLCYGNDWLPAAIHVQADQRRTFEKSGFSLQKIGQEAVLEIVNFARDTANDKYFRQIRNRFAKQGFTTEMLQPPHHAAVLDRLNKISKEWLQGGHDERGFAMGYYSTDYMQLCPVMVVRDAAGTIQAFVNQLPSDFDEQEANFDLLRQTKSSPGNINDFLLMGFIAHLQEHGYQRLNLGLCPLSGLSEPEAEKGNVISSVLRFAYANGDRFYSFSGLHRFKSKYDPSWRDRYIAYQGGVRGFTRTTNALMRTMRVKRLS